MLPDLESLRCFEAAATHATFRAAAEAVALSPAAFGDRIARLEAMYEQPLFVRTTRRVSLAPAGLRLLPQARRVLEEARRCASVVQPGGARPKVELTIATRFELGLSFLLPAITELQEKRPERTLHLAVGSGPEILRLVRTGEADAAVTSARFALPGVTHALLHAEEYVFVASPRLLKRHPLRGPSDAARHTLLDVSADLPLFRYLLDGVPADERWSFGRLHFLGSGAAIRLRVLEGEGVAVLPKHMVARELATRRLVRVLPKRELPPDRFRLVWRLDHPAQDELHILARELAKRPLT